jgi:hypothetical protein
MNAPLAIEPVLAGAAAAAGVADGAPRLREIP